MGKEIVSELTSKITAMIREVFPALVADELLKLGKSGVRREKESLYEACVRLRGAGKTQEEIAKELHTTQPYVCRLLSGRTRTTLKPSSLKAALAKYGSRTKAADALGIPRQTFSDRLARES